MSEKVRQIISFVFKRSGKQRLTESEFYLTISMDLKWCPPKRAKEFVSHLISLGVLKKEGEDVFPEFDVDDVVIPLGFHPQEEDFIFDDSEGAVDTSETKDALEHVVHRIQAKTLLDKGRIEKEISRLIEKKHIHRSAALALFARFYNVSITDLLPELKEEILTGNTG
jgi:hypothetical protein